MNPIVTAAAAYLLLGSPSTPQPTPVPSPIMCALPPANCASGWDHDCKSEDLHPRPVNHLTIRWVGERHHHHPPHHRGH